MIGEGLSQAFKGFIDKCGSPYYLGYVASIFPNVTLFQDLSSGFDSIVEYVKAPPEKIVGFFMSIPGRLKNLFANILPNC